MANVSELYVNGKLQRIAAEPERSLLSILRDDLELTGTKYGCGEGQCGACTVLIDGFPQRSCQTPFGTIGKKKITTVEGLEHDGTLHPVQQAFVDAGAMQCAYCTSGMIMLAVGLLRRNPNPTSEEIVRFMEGNICRCGTYPRIVAAIRAAAKMAKEKRP